MIFGILQAGAIYTGIPVAYGRREAASIPRTTDSRILFVPGTADHVALARELRKDAPQLRRVVVLGEAPEEEGWLTFTALTANQGGSKASVSPGGSRTHRLHVGHHG